MSRSHVFTFPLITPPITYITTRLTSVQVDVNDAYTSMISDFRRLPKAKAEPMPVPASAGGLNKTNWDLEIRKRYAQPLASESGEFPDTTTIESRMLPICYETGLISGHSSDAAQFMSVATETFVKEFLSSVFDKTRSNGPGSGGSAGSGGGASWVMTHKYRRQLEKEEEAWLRGEIHRDKSGLLPVEAKAAGERGALGMADLRMALEMGDCGLGQMPVVFGQIMFDFREGEVEGWEDFSILDGYEERAAKKRRHEDVVMTGFETTGKKANGMNGVNGMNGHVEEDGDSEGWGWEGVGTEDYDSLNNLLDSCLAIGS